MMKNLTTQLLEAGLSLPQIKTCLFLIEDWLDDHYPILAKIYHTEFIQKDLIPFEHLLSEKKDVLQPVSMKNQTPGMHLNHVIHQRTD